MKTDHHSVHILRDGDLWKLRTGLFEGFIGWQTAEAAKCQVPTRDEQGRPIVECLDGLDRATAEACAEKVREYFARQNSGRKERKVKALDEVKEKYRRVMER